MSMSMDYREVCDVKPKQDNGQPAEILRYAGKREWRDHLFRLQRPKTHYCRVQAGGQSQNKGGRRSPVEYAP
jgi:hypothetical protein